ncbi:hypothetical protein [Acinetobacter schindleri]|uniref:hypothetical protein n=1 Tax=Acinetobacter schindleri TaxID=108981 RepID=UPI002DBE05BE|nr:hypothetical protein [Acinetobacter schindleri]MEB5930114.1 hypothetical protein [Acinetobacter schindleri]
MKDAETNRLIDKLMALYLTKGVQPSELADAIFEESYVNMISQKTNGLIEVTLSFHEKCEETFKYHVHSMKYVYNLDCFLIQIEESIDSNNFKLVWSRDSSAQIIIRDIQNRLLDIGYTKDAIEIILKTLPKNSICIKNLKLQLVS